MRIENNKMVSLIYELRETDSGGRVLETLDETRPLSFIYGTGRLIPSFEENISALSEGDNFSFALEAGNAYGDRREDMIIDIPKNVFETDGKLNEEICWVGNQVRMVDSDGNPLSGIINEITDNFVKMDFNHPMAGVDLFFSGRVLEVRDATDMELAGIMTGCSSCGSSRSGCGGSCG